MSSVLARGSRLTVNHEIRIRTYKKEITNDAFQTA